MNTKKLLSKHRLTRRDMLKLSGTLAAGSLLAACAPATTPTEAPAATDVPEVPTTEVLPTAAPTQAKLEGRVVFMIETSELSDEQRLAFMDENPGIIVDQLSHDFTRFFAMYAAGQPPDVLRVEAPMIPQFLARDILLDLTPYFDTSQLLRPDDLGDVNNYYRANSPMDVGSGPIYGVNKDWSPDFSLWIFEPAFEAAKVPIPEDTQVYTYAEVGQLAEDLAVIEGDRVATWGYGFFDWWMDRVVMNMLAETDQSLYKDSFTKVDLTQNEETKAIFTYYVDLARKKLIASPVNPSPSWVGGDFTAGILAIEQSGYWFSGMVETDVTKGKIKMIPGPTWSGKRRNPSMAAVGTIISKGTQIPDLAWHLFEWFGGGQPAIDRAKSGWGVPGLKSMYQHMPTEGEFRQQVNRALQTELELNTSPLKFNPFMGISTFQDAWSKNLEQVLRDEITLDEGLANTEKEVNEAIKDGIDRIS